jgi:long-chain acyl-CoA synthetase
MNLDTIPKILYENSQKWANEPAMRNKERGIWREYTWKEVYKQVKYLSLGLTRLGLAKGDKAIVIGDNMPELFWAGFAVQVAGGINIGVFVDSIPQEIKFIVNHSDAKFAIVADQEQTDKLLQIKHEIPQVEKIIYWDAKGLAHYDDPLLMDFGQLKQIGSDYDKECPGTFEENIRKSKGEDICAYYYTSGTGGIPKAAMLTYDAIMASSKAHIEKIKLRRRDELVSCFPAAWIPDTIFATVPHLITGAKLNFPEEPETLQEDLREVGPHVVAYGPKQWESLSALIEFKISDGVALQRFFYRLFQPSGFKRADFKVLGKKPSLPWKFLFALGDLLVFKRILDKVGLRRVRVAITGSASMSTETFRFWRALGLELRQIYAGTESGLVSGHEDGDVKDETVGRIAEGVDVKISDQGEILVKGPGTFSGYYKDSEKTKEVLEEGWFHTGDAGYVREDGHLVFLDRLSDVKELANGHKYAPQYIEGLLRSSPYIKDTLVIGDQDKRFISTIIDIDFDNVGKWAESHHISYTTFADLSQKKEVAGLIRKDIDRVNEKLESWLRIKKYVLLHKEFDPDEAELTRTRKLRRGFMEKRYLDLINAIYADQEEILIEAEVKYQDGRIGTVKTPIKIVMVN